MPLVYCLVDNAVPFDLNDEAKVIGRPLDSSFTVPPGGSCAVKDDGFTEDLNFKNKIMYGSYVIAIDTQGGKPPRSIQSFYVAGQEAPRASNFTGIAVDIDAVQSCSANGRSYRKFKAQCDKCA